MFGDSKGWAPFATDIESGFDTYEVEVRRGFMRKVFGTVQTNCPVSHCVLSGLLSLQLFITASIGGFIVGVASIKNFIYENVWVFYLVMLASFAFLIVLTCVPDLKNKHPHNLILLFSFTACEGILIGAIAAAYNLNEVILAAAITVGVTVGLTLFALQTKWDFTMLSGTLFSCLLVLVLASFIFAVFPTNGIGSVIFSSLGALLFSVYLVYDVQLIVGGGKYELGPDDYVQAALSVYLDIINLFLFILRLVSSRD